MSADSVKEKSWIDEYCEYFLRTLIIADEFRQRPFDPVFDGRPIARIPEWSYGLSKPMIAEVPGPGQGRKRKAKAGASELANIPAVQVQPTG